MFQIYHNNWNIYVLFTYALIFSEDRFFTNLNYGVTYSNLQNTPVSINLLS